MLLGEVVAVARAKGRFDCTMAEGPCAHITGELILLHWVEINNKLVAEVNVKGVRIGLLRDIGKDGISFFNCSVFEVPLGNADQDFVRP